MEISVRHLLQQRQKTRSSRGQRADPYHLALVIEGGGMRGVVAGGMVTALEARGLLGCFDSIHGSSAGACAGAYFLAGQARLGTRIYYEDINNKRFINLWRPWIGRPTMNTHFLIDHVMRVDKPLDVSRILATRDVLHIVATDADSGEGRVYNRFRDAEHFFSVLKGSITIPVIAGAPVEVDGIRLVDGGVVQQIALESAFAAGASHIVVLMTRKEAELERPGWTPRLAIESLILRLMHNGRLAGVYERRNRDINQVLAFIGSPERSELIESIVRPAGASEVGRLTTDTLLLEAADEEAQRAVFAYLDGSPEFGR
jgi:predicted patatin/cPLA2 family phospholipase